ncbi:MAG: 2-oxo acid dehydrogenase subunit E2 [Actinobacteria bacterium]|nr:2-oxo acid dehydrogenase subunit E2 [Actinomycetota bacterium]
MATREFKLPDIGEGLTEAEIVRWLVAEGDKVEADQPVVEVETDKAVVEIPSPYSGVVVRHGGAEGDTIEVGQVLVVIGDEEDAAADELEERQEPPAEPEPAGRSEPIVGSLSEDAEVLTTSEDRPSNRSTQVKALPLVRKLAREHDIDLTGIEGSGPGGRITREDVEAAIEPASGDGRREAEEPAEEPPEPREASGARPPDEEVEPGPRGEGERRQLSRLRRTIAANMSKSWAEIPHVTTFDDVDATRLVEVRAALGHRYDMTIPMEALVVKAVIPALREYPDFNATLDGDDLVLHGRHDIGIAVDTPEGLLVAVIRNAGSMSVVELAEEVRRLGEGAKSRSLGPDELSGQTFTISNIGAVGGGHGTPIVPYGTVAILSVGRAREKPIVFEDDLVIAPVMPLSLSYDHRAIDGAVGRRFISLVIENLEEPALFLSV